METHDAYEPQQRSQKCLIHMSNFTPACQGGLCTKFDVEECIQPYELVRVNASSSSEQVCVLLRDAECSDFATSMYSEQIVEKSPLSDIERVVKKSNFTHEAIKQRRQTEYGDLISLKEERQSSGLDAVGAHHRSTHFDEGKELAQDIGEQTHEPKTTIKRIGPQGREAVLKTEGTKTKKASEALSESGSVSTRKDLSTRRRASSHGSLLKKSDNSLNNSIFNSRAIQARHNQISQPRNNLDFQENLANFLQAIIDSDEAAIPLEQERGRGSRSNDVNLQRIMLTKSESSSDERDVRFKKQIQISDGKENIQRKGVNKSHFAVNSDENPVEDFILNIRASDIKERSDSEQFGQRHGIRQRSDGSSDTQGEKSKVVERFLTGSFHRPDVPYMNNLGKWNSLGLPTPFAPPSVRK